MIKQKIEELIDVLIDRKKSHEKEKWLYSEDEQFGWAQDGRIIECNFLIKELEKILNEVIV